MLGFLKAVTALCSAAFAVLAPEAPLNDVKNLEGKPLPPFEMTTVAGKKVNNATLKGKPAVIDFWATWCGPCKKASPVMQSLSKEFGPKGLIVIGANGLEESTGPKPAATYAREHKFTYLFTHSNDKLMQDWGIVGVPTIIFVDRAGKVSKVYVGYGDNMKDELRAKAKSLVSART